MKEKNHIQGFTLLELVFAIIILSLGAASFTVLINQTTRRSIDPMIVTQAHSLAQSYLEEVMLNSFCDPDYDTDSNPATPLNCPADCVASVCDPGGCRNNGSATEGNRSLFDDVCDYGGLNHSAGALDQNNNPVAGMGDYNITVTVDDSTATVDGLNAVNGQLVRIDVRVTHDTFPDLDFTLSGYRTNY